MLADVVFALWAVVATEVRKLLATTFATCTVAMPLRVSRTAQRPIVGAKTSEVVALRATKSLGGRRPLDPLPMSANNW